MNNYITKDMNEFVSTLSDKESGLLEEVLTNYAIRGLNQVKTLGKGHPESVFTMGISSFLSGDMETAHTFFSVATELGCKWSPVYIENMHKDGLGVTWLNSLSQHGIKTQIQEEDSEVLFMSKDDKVIHINKERLESIPEEECLPYVIKINLTSDDGKITALLNLNPEMGRDVAMGYEDMTPKLNELVSKVFSFAMDKSAILENNTKWDSQWQYMYSLEDSGSEYALSNRGMTDVFNMPKTMEE